MKQEIMQDASGPWPRLVGCTTFSQLHDIVDANEYGGFCESDFPGGPADIEDSGLAHADQFLEAQMRFINAAQDAVHQWLLGGGLIPIVGLHADTAIPLVLVGGVVVALVSLVVGITDHETEIAFLVVLLPLTFWAYVFAILYASTRPMMGGALFAGGLGFVAWSVVRLQRSRAQALVFQRRALQ